MAPNGVLTCKPISAMAAQMSALINCAQPMATKAPYRIVRKALSFSGSDVLLSAHRSEQAAQRAFDGVVGRAVLIGPNGDVLNHRIV